MPIENLTVVVPFWNGHETLGRLLDSLPAGLPVLVVDDQSDESPDVNGRAGVRVIRPKAKGFFSGAVNAGLKGCRTDVLVLNQDLWFTSDGWLDRVAEMRDRVAFFGDGVMAHPAWKKGYVQGTFMFMRRDMIGRAGMLNAEEYPLWGATAEYQLRACRHGFQAQADRDWRRWYGHEGRHGEGGKPVVGRRPRFGGAITEAMKRWPSRRWQFVRTPPAISVIMPCYNYGRYLEDAVHSLVGGETSLGAWELPGQTFQSFEVIIVDDASTDDSWERAQALVDPYKGIRAIRLKENRGTPGAINAGIEKAFGEFVHILSADDMREAWGLEKFYQAIKADRDAVIYGNVRIFQRGKRGRMLTLPAYDFDLVLHKNPMPAGTLYARSAWQAVGGYPENMKYGREDWAFNIRLGMHGYCGKHIGDSGNLYRREGQNRSLRTGNVHRGEPRQEAGFSWRAKFMEQLHGLYPSLYQGERPMGCCSGSRTAKAKTVPDEKTLGRRMVPSAAMEDKLQAAKAAVTTTDPGMAFLEYIGGNTGNTYWWGPKTNTRYTFGGGRPIGQVYKEDLAPMLNIRIKTKPVFKLWIAPTPVKLVQVEPEREVEANPPDPDDLTRIKGVGMATAAKLLEAGYPSFLALARASAEKMAIEAGLTGRQAKIAVSGAREILGWGAGRE